MAIQDKKPIPTTDRRIQRTKEALRTAFLTLLAEKPFEDITVSGLAEQAGINRKTFYLHYTSTRDLQDEIRREETARIAGLKCWKSFLKGNSEPDPYEFFLEMNQLIQSDKMLYRALFSPTIATNYLPQIKEQILASEELREVRRLRPDIDYYLDYTISGLFSLYLRWLTSENQISIEELARIATELSQNGLNPLKEIAKSNPTMRPKAMPLPLPNDDF